MKLKGLGHLESDDVKEQLEQAIAPLLSEVVFVISSNFDSNSSLILLVMPICLKRMRLI
jgi:hypothetical protein